MLYFDDAGIHIDNRLPTKISFNILYLKQKLTLIYFKSFYPLLSTSGEDSRLDLNIIAMNLRLLDYYFPKIITSIVNIALEDGLSELTDILPLIIKENPVDFNLSFGHPFYENKIMDLLASLVLKLNSRHFNFELCYRPYLKIFSTDNQPIYCIVYNPCRFRKFLLDHASIHILEVKEFKNGKRKIDFHFGLAYPY